MKYRAGVRLEEISKIFGHSNTRMTMHYIGLDFDDMSDAMRIYAQLQKMSFELKIVQNEMSQSFGGQSGICVWPIEWVAISYKVSMSRPDLIDLTVKDMGMNLGCTDIGQFTSRPVLTLQKSL